jgi:signal transduction histidine kinase/CheY-like chemotaxis protein
VTRYGIALVAVLLAVATRQPLSVEHASIAPFIPLFPAVLVAAVLGGLGPGVVAAILSAAAWWWLLHVPPLLLRLPYGEYLRLAIFLAAAVLVVGVGVLLRRSLDQLAASETMARAAKAEAERTNLAKSKFLAAASHDLRQPVQSLTLFMDLLKRRHGGTDDARLLNNMEAALEVLGTLLNSLLDVSKLDAGLIQAKVELMAVSPLLARLAAEYRPRVEAAGLRLRVSPCRAIVRTDPVLLERMLRNLLENSLKYTKRGGILLGCRRCDGRLRIEVVDTGIGIAPDKLEEVFEEFYQTNNEARDRAKGLGLGLAVVRRLGRLLDHPVEVRSAPGRGSCFAISLPLVARGEPAPSPPPAPPAGGAGTLMVVEDDAIVRLGLEATLEALGHTVLGAQSVAEAVVLVRRQPPDAILADYRLQEGATGLQAIRAIHAELGRAIPATILTGDTAAERLAEAKAGGFRLLHKPVAMLDLQGAVADMLRESRRPEDGPAGAGPARGRRDLDGYHRAR